MIMDRVCPYCGGKDFSLVERDFEYISDNEYMKDWNVTCLGCRKEFMMSEVHSITSRLVARDLEELDALIDKELETEVEE